MFCVGHRRLSEGVQDFSDGTVIQNGKMAYLDTGFVNDIGFLVELGVVS